MKSETELELEIHTSNELKKVIIALIQLVLPMLKPFIGKKIFVADGGKSKLFNIVIPTIVLRAFNGGNVTMQTCYFRSDYNKLVLRISLCFSGGRYEDNSYYCKYVDRNVDLGD